MTESIREFDIPGALDPLFSAAKEADEFEFCCTLLRVRGVVGRGRDALFESSQLVAQLTALFHAPIEHSLRLRLLLFLYCHVTEMYDFYAIPANLLRITAGERCSMTPFIGELHSSGKNATSLTKRVARLGEWSEQHGFPAVGEMFETMLVKNVRNAFYHSDYGLTEETFEIVSGAGVKVNDVIRQSVPLEWLAPRLELGINSARYLLRLVFEHRASYTDPKVVRGRFGPSGEVVDIELTVGENGGLTGFRSPPPKREQESAAPN